MPARAFAGWELDWWGNITFAAGVLVQRRIDGSALAVLNEILTWEPRP